MIVPPHDIWAENWILWCLMIDPDLYYDLSVKPEDMYENKNRLVLQYMNELVTAWKNINLINMLWITWKYPDVDWDYILKIADWLMVASWFKDYNETVKDAAVRRNIINASQRTVSMCYWTTPVNDIVSTLMTCVDNISWAEEADYFDQALAEYWVWSKSIQRYWIDSLDQMTSWIHAGNLIILWARTHVGKTLFSTFLTTKIAMNWDRVWYITFEMLGKEIADRILTCAFGLWTEKLSKTADQLNIDTDVLNKIKSNVDIYFKCKTIDDIILSIRKSNAKHWTRVFFIDHLGLIQSNKKDSRNNLIWEYTSKLKNLTTELGITIICLSQLNRASAKEWAEPKLYDLRDSWNIEQDADVVILLHREYDAEGKMYDSMKIIVAKNRVNGQFWSVIAEIDPKKFSLF